MIDVFNVTGANLASFGGRGFRILNAGDSLPTGEVCYAMLALDNTAITATAINEIGDTNVATTLFAGIMIYGNFDTITVSSGQLLAYLR